MLKTKDKKDIKEGDRFYLDGDEDRLIFEIVVLPQNGDGVFWVFRVDGGCGCGCSKKNPVPVRLQGTLFSAETEFQRFVRETLSGTKTGR